MTLDNRNVEATRRRKGFQADDTQHQRFSHFAADGRATGIRTHTSHASRLGRSFRMDAGGFYRSRTRVKPQLRVRTEADEP